MTTDSDRDRIRQVSDLLYRATRPIRILSHVAWSDEVRIRFFERGAKELPEVSYPPFDPSEPIAVVGEARRYIGTSGRVDRWFGRLADVIEKSARMLAACGTPDFFRFSSELYGTPSGKLPDETTTALGLASQFDRLMGTFTGLDLGAPPAACHLAQAVADEMDRASKAMFGADAPEVLIVDELSANALAGPRRIRIRRTGCFTDKDISQLVHHEAYVHVATSLNGLAQPDLKILGASHPGNAKTQEGLAVFAEFVTGSIDLDRMRRLGDRVLAIQMAIDGADFLDVYRYFLGRTSSDTQAFENTRRVFRGGMVSGGAPFTKDIVYLDGLLRVHSFLHAIVTTGRADCLRLLFCGKLDIEDIPVLQELSNRGMCIPPKYLPPWAADLRFLLCHLAYSSFLNGIDISQVEAHYGALLNEAPA